MTNWTTERGGDGAQSRPRARFYTGTTLLMSTAELLAVLEDGLVPATAPTGEPEIESAAPPVPAAPAPPRPHRIAPASPPLPPPRPGLLRRLRCVRRGHDPRPHRPLPHDEVVYRCLRCGRSMPAPRRP